MVACDEGFDERYVCGGYVDLLVLDKIVQHHLGTFFMRPFLFRPNQVNELRTIRGRKNRFLQYGWNEQPIPNVRPRAMSEIMAETG